MASTKFIKIEESEEKIETAGSATSKENFDYIEMKTIAAYKLKVGDMIICENETDLIIGKSSSLNEDEIYFSIYDGREIYIFHALHSEEIRLDDEFEFIPG